MLNWVLLNYSCEQFNEVYWENINSQKLEYWNKIIFRMYAPQTIKNVIYAL